MSSVGDGTSTPSNSYTVVKFFDGSIIDCLIDPVDGKGGVYIGNIEAA